MPLKPTRYALHKTITASLQHYQEQQIIPHCRQCLRPCCKLTDVVLEFDWPTLVRFYGFEQGQRAFDRSLRDGSGPSYIRKQGQEYFAHGEPCPAYESATGLCRFYQSPLKPENCTDFPIYLDEDTIVADQRCEAVNADALLQHLRQALPDQTFTRRAHPDFPFLIYIRHTTQQPSRKKQKAR